MPFQKGHKSFKKIHQLKCNICLNDFLGLGGRKYCSDKCRKIKGAEWARLHKDEAIKRIKKLRQNPEYRKKQCLWNNKWKEKNKTKFLAIRVKSEHKRRLLISNKESYSHKEWENLKKLYNYTCLCCGLKEPEIKLTVDHIQPICKNGSNVIDNIQPLCGSCNSKKQNKWISYRKLYS